jgi:hypothetical protein
LRSAVVEVDLSFDNPGLSDWNRVRSDLINQLEGSLLIELTFHCIHLHFNRTDIGDRILEAYFFDTVNVIAGFQLKRSELFLQIKISITGDVDQGPLKDPTIDLTDAAVDKDRKRTPTNGRDEELNPWADHGRSDIQRGVQQGHAGNADIVNGIERSQIFALEAVILIVTVTANFARAIRLVGERDDFKNSVLGEAVRVGRGDLITRSSIRQLADNFNRSIAINRRIRCRWFRRWIRRRIGRRLGRRLGGRLGRRLGGRIGGSIRRWISGRVREAEFRWHGGLLLRILVVVT